MKKRAVKSAGDKTTSIALQRAGKRSPAKVSKSARPPKKAKKAKPTAWMETAYPMVAEIDDLIHSQIPKEIIQKIKKAKSKRHIVGSTYPYKTAMGTADYERIIRKLHVELVKMQAWVIQSGKQIVMLFEGRDAAGKGGTIKRFTEHLNPRGARVVALTKPTETEQGQWYFQRYVEQMPTKGEIVFFDRSWYNRAGVERVMNFCTPNEYLEFMRQAPEFERMLVRSGILLFKFWFAVSREEQLRRFMGRAKDPLRHWKLSPIDMRSLGRWDEYTKARDDMLFYTDTADAPWTIVRSDDKKRARLNAIMYTLKQIPYAGKDKKALKTLDSKIVGKARNNYDIGKKRSD